MAIGTMLGFTLMGKSSQEVNDNTEVSTPDIRERQLSMFLNQLNVKELWDLETIGIRDPVENIKKYCEMNSDLDLHVFVDASKEAYAACIFVRTKLASGNKLRLLRAKARVAPTKSVSMPRLELLACCVGTRLANSIRNSLDIPDLKITYWSDSMVALHWIKNNGEWSIFVSNPIKEIARISSPENWRHVPGRMNPTDVLSRGCSPRYLLESKWFGGPEWLLGNAVTWPKMCYNVRLKFSIGREENLSCVILMLHIEEKRGIQ
ncbi:uncharacterized protein TNCV_2463001 [Trichonephila clavipes]|nr:uncharacterized protein TNCV_2463001 [Trichonephila clavipes]